MRHNRVKKFKMKNIKGDMPREGGVMKASKNPCSLIKMLGFCKFFSDEGDFFLSMRILGVV